MKYTTIQDIVMNFGRPETTDDIQKHWYSFAFLYRSSNADDYSFWRLNDDFAKQNYDEESVCLLSIQIGLERQCVTKSAIEHARKLSNLNIFNSQLMSVSYLGYMSSNEFWDNPQ